MLNIYNMLFLVIATVALLQTGCVPAVQTTPMMIDETRYDPAVSRYPASVGVYFPDDFFENNFYHETNDGHEHTFHNNPADATRRTLKLAFETTFAETRYLNTLQDGLAAEDLAFVIIPNIVSMTAVLDPQVIAVRLVYQFDFFADGEHLQAWHISGLDAINRSIVPTASTLSGPIYPAISPEKFDAVARRAVWDAISVLLADLDQQKYLTDRLPTPLLTDKVVEVNDQTAADLITLAMVGPVFDQGHVPEKQRLETCLIEEIQDNGLSLKTVPLHNLRDHLYPWLSRSNYPRRLNDLALIIKEPAVKERLQELGVQYVLNWDGETIQSQFEGPFYVTAYGVIGYESAEKTSMIKADLLAVEDGNVVTSFEAIREGTDALLGLVWIPLPITMDTEEDACEEITRQIDYFIQANAQSKQDPH